MPLIDKPLPELIQTLRSPLPDIRVKTARALGKLGRQALEALPGVGRKTANVVLNVAFGEPTLAVDTHVFRVSARLGLTLGAKNPLQCEKQLITFIPESLIPRAHHWLILHGRYVCIARGPKCGDCGLQDYCKFFEDKIKPKKGPSHGKKIKKSGKEKNR